jgi:flotillin
MPNLHMLKFISQIPPGQLPTDSLMGGFVTAIFILIGVVLFLAAVKSLLYICPPNEVLIFSGRKSRTADGTLRGYRTIFGGRGWRVPIIETVQRMSLSTVEVPITIKNAYSQGGIPLSVDAVANVKITNDERLITNAIERFLGRDLNEIRRVSKETLEGHLRGVLARLTPEEVNEDRLKFAEELSRESELDLSKLGIHLDTLKILHVSDDTHYLDSIGREAIALVIKEAEMSESDQKRAAELIEAENAAKADVVNAQVDATISQMKNDLRRIHAELDSQIRSEEERTLAAAREARAIAEQGLQKARAQLEAIRLQAETVLPAEAMRVAQEYKAKGDAAIFKARGDAVSQAVQLLNDAWSEVGDEALSIYLIDDIEKILESASKGVHKVKIENLNMIDSGDGSTLPSILAAYPAMLNTVFDAVANTTGIDIPKSISVRSENKPTTENKGGQA